MSPGPSPGSGGGGGGGGDAAAAPFVRVALLEIDPAQTAAFASAAKALGQASVRHELGCLALYALADQQSPGRVTVLELYRDEAAYQVHLQSAHFAAFRVATDAIVLSRQLSSATPLSLAQQYLLPDLKGRTP